MIRLEVKVVIPDHRKREEFLKLLLDSAADDIYSVFWQTPIDMMEMDRGALEAVLGTEGFPFMKGCKLLIMVCDFANKKHADAAVEFFKSLAISWEIEINEFTGKRLYSDLLDVDDFE